MKNIKICKVIYLLLCTLDIILMISMFLQYKNILDAIDIYNSIYMKSVVDVRLESITKNTDMITSDIIYYQEEVTTLNKPYIDLTCEEIDMLSKLVWLEGRGESRECQLAIASVVINRVTISGKSIYDVIYAKNQFEPACYISTCKISEEDLNNMRGVVTDIAEYGPSIPGYVTYFRADYYHNWSSDIVAYDYYDNTYFSYDINIYNRYLNEERVSDE